jgi:hypothetical protein
MKLLNFNYEKKGKSIEGDIEKREISVTLHS